MARFFGVFSALLLVALLFMVRGYSILNSRYRVALQQRQEQGLVYSDYGRVAVAPTELTTIFRSLQELRQDDILAVSPAAKDVEAQLAAFIAALAVVNDRDLREIKVLFCDPRTGRPVGVAWMERSSVVTRTADAE